VLSGKLNNNKGVDMKRAYADTPEGQVHYRIEGRGDAVLLLHAAVTSSDEYTRVIPFLSKNYCAIAMDFLGNGDSDPAPYPYRISDHARTVISFMDRLGIKKATIVSHSVGTKVAVELAAIWPDRVKNLVLCGLGIRPEPGERLTFKEPSNFTDAVKIESDGSHLMEWWRRASLWGDPLEIIEERFIEYIKAGPRGEEIHWAGHDYNPAAMLPFIKCPTLMILGTKEPFYSGPEKLKKLFPEAKFTIIENGPIHVTRVMPKEFAEAILDFLGERAA
jgi:pimeloyl-ACP methyl ester carboxylesterase